MHASYGDDLLSMNKNVKIFIPEIYSLHFLFPSSLFETTQTLFWAAFGLIDLDSFELDGIKIFTRFWGMLMFGCYSVINIVVLLNLLIAMMNHSYQLISVSCHRNVLHEIFHSRSLFSFANCKKREKKNT